MMLYFSLFLIFQITATKSLYIDNHPAYFEDAQIEQVSETVRKLDKSEKWKIYTTLRINSFSFSV